MILIMMMTMMMMLIMTMKYIRWMCEECDSLAIPFFGQTCMSHLKMLRICLQSSHTFIKMWKKYDLSKIWPYNKNLCQALLISMSETVLYKPKLSRRRKMFDINSSVHNLLRILLIKFALLRFFTFGIIRVTDSTCTTFGITR